MGHSHGANKAWVHAQTKGNSISKRKPNCSLPVYSELGQNPPVMEMMEILNGLYDVQSARMLTIKEEELDSPLESLSNFLVRFQRALEDVQVQIAHFSDVRKKAKLECALTNKEDALRALNTYLQLMELTSQEACLRVITFDQTEDGVARLKDKIRNSASNVEDEL